MRQAHDTARACERRLKEIFDEMNALLKSTPKKALCPDCGLSEGEIHEYGCDMEVCPFCGNQLLACMCDFEEVKEPVNEIWDEDIDAISKRLGISREDVVKIQDALLDIHYDKWHAVREKKGRIPFVLYPVICAKCGELWPEFFRVPSEEWERYVALDMRRSVICHECYDEIETLIDNAKGDEAGGEEDEQA